MSSALLACVSAAVGLHLPHLPPASARTSRAVLMQEAATGARSLSPSCTWRIALNLRAPNTPDEEESQLVTAVVRFAEEPGYEPPQGKLRVESCLPEGLLRIGEAEARWVLSEDPEDRKDSLWIWGLFKEPLYPFLLFSLDCEEIALPGGSTIPKGKLYVQADHRRHPEDGVRLGEGKVTYKVAEQLSADLLGLSDFTYNEPISCGTSSFLDG